MLFFLKFLAPWIAQISKSSGHKYYFCVARDGKVHSLYHIPSEARMDMISSFTKRVMWPWEPSANAIFEGHQGIQDTPSCADVEQYVSSIKSKQKTVH